MPIVNSTKDRPQYDIGSPQGVEHLSDPASHAILVRQWPIQFTTQLHHNWTVDVFALSRPLPYQNDIPRFVYVPSDDFMWSLQCMYWKTTEPLLYHSTHAVEVNK